MANLKIRVVEKAGKTHSKFVSRKFENVIFQNDSGKVATITIKDATPTNSPICDASGPAPSFNVQPHAQSTFWVCSDWAEFKYSAQISGTTAEDPIVIIERKSFASMEKKPIVIIEKAFSGGEGLFALGGLVVGLLLGILLARTFELRGSRPRN